MLREIPTYGTLRHAVCLVPCNLTLFSWRAIGGYKLWSKSRNKWKNAIFPAALSGSVYLSLPCCFLSGRHNIRGLFAWCCYCSTVAYNGWSHPLKTMSKHPAKRLVLTRKFPNAGRAYNAHWRGRKTGENYRYQHAPRQRWRRATPGEIGLFFRAF